MSTPNPIDELLKSSFKSFEATPPVDAWGAIQQGVSQAGAAGATNAAVIVKSAALTTKIIIAVASIAALAGSYVAYRYLNSNAEKTDAKKNEQPVIQTNVNPESTEPVQENLKVVKPESSASPNTEKSASPLPKYEAKKELTDPVSSDKVITADPIHSENQAEQISQNGQKTTIKTDPNPVQSQPKTQPTKSQKMRKDYFAADENKPAEKGNETQDQKPNIHNAITPNNDGSNDRLIIEIENEDLYDLKIFDADGNSVFESNSKEQTWDGTDSRSGQLCENGYYTYQFKYRYKNSDKVHTAKGLIQLLR